jgi:hypothetical protein
MTCDAIINPERAPKSQAEPIQLRSAPSSPGFVSDFLHFSIVSMSVCAARIKSC